MSASDCDPKELVEAAIDLTLPSRIGHRNRRLFDFARRLKGIPGFAAPDAGELAIDTLQSILGPLPRTCKQTTGRGRQLFFAYPTNATIRNTTTFVGHKGIDVREEGGYAIIPLQSIRTARCTHGKLRPTRSTAASWPRCRNHGRRRWMDQRGPGRPTDDPRTRRDTPPRADTR
ncbi:MAG: bifunctional DNA primase/polymerase [Planctomycetes bacterium]|nr:bifunctional DNA primase/polymerase [Planctomycetota bacterium]